MVKDAYGNTLNLYDLVALEKIPKSCLDSTEEEDSEWNKVIKSQLNRYGMLYYFHEDVPDPRWYYEGSDNLSITIRFVHKYTGSEDYFPKESILDFPLAIEPKYVRRIEPNPIMMYPYAAFKLQIGVMKFDADDPDDIYEKFMNDVSPPLETFDICKKILTTPLDELEELGSKMFKDFLVSS